MRTIVRLFAFLAFLAVVLLLVGIPAYVLLATHAPVPQVNYLGHGSAYSRATGVPILLPMLIAGLFLLGIFALLVLLIRLATSPRKKRETETDTSETRMIQELHHGFSRLEDRVEALETILMDQMRGRRSRDREPTIR